MNDLESSGALKHNQRVIPHSRPTIGIMERDAVLSTLEASWVGAGGENSRHLEDELADYFRRDSALPVASGSAAIEIALRVIGTEGSAVAMPAYSCMSIKRAIVRAGGVPLELDVDARDLSFQSGTLTSLPESCAAIVLVHQFGLPARAGREVPGLTIPVVEDVTASVGATAAGGQAVGTSGRMTVMSFSATKMVCAGEGGALVGDAMDIERARAWADPESTLPAWAPVPNAKMSAMACSLARVQLGRLPELISRRRQIARYYDQVLAERSERVRRPLAEERGTWWRYLVAVEHGHIDRVLELARARGVTFARPVPETSWTARGQFPVADSLHATLVSVPIFPTLSDAEVERVGDVLDATVPW